MRPEKLFLAWEQDVLSACPQCSTVGDFFRGAVTLLDKFQVAFGQGTENAKDDAAFLIARSLGLDPEEIGGYFSARLLAEERREIFELLRQRVIRRVPSAYILQEAWFCGHIFFVDDRVLIPRSFLGEIISSRWDDLGFPVPSRALDLGTGSGCLAVLLARRFPGAKVHAADISPGAIEVAQENLRRHGLEGQVKLFVSDWFSALPEGSYDLIVANPPYVPEEALKGFPPEFAREPWLAFSGGREGVDAVEKILEGACSRLSPEGLLLIEAAGLKEKLEALFPNLPFFWVSTQGEEHVLAITREDLQSALDAGAKS